MSRTNTKLIEWLGKYSLDQYAQTFAENDIEYAALSVLTENDLENLGIPLGHRKKLLKAIEALTLTQRPRAATGTSSSIGAELSSPLENREPEVRQITVMFCDLVGSTGLSEKLDPEDLRTLIIAYRKVCDAAIRRYEGQVASYASDGVLAFFGWPRAHEDDAVRAVHAALTILSEVTNIPGEVALSVRVGICSGRVVVSQTSGPGGRMEGGGRHAKYCCLAANARGAQHSPRVRLYATTRIGSL